jgi:sarcosine oxidase delta subunit
MKILFLILSISLSVASFGQTGAQRALVNTVPVELITDDSTFWTVSTVSTVGYVNTTPGPNYNSYQSGGGMLVKFRFKKNNRFEFQLYVQANTYGTMTEAWTHVEGSVEFTKDAKGQSVFITKAEKGTYRTTKMGKTNTRPVPQSDLNAQHSNTYLWEKTNFADDTRHTYLLVVDMDAHPEVDLNNPKSIDPSWVSKFHIPVK